MATVYTYEALKQMRGQAVKDIWHSMIGKPAGIKNTTGLKNGEEIMKAILEAQQNPEFLKQFQVRGPKQTVGIEPKEMPPKASEKKKPGPKPKIQVAPVNPKPLQAYESTEIPIQPQEVKKIVVRKLFVNDTLYFLDSKTNKVYCSVDGRPGTECGLWNRESRTIQA